MFDSFIYLFQTEPKLLNTSVFDFSNISHCSGSGHIPNVIEISTDFNSSPRPGSQRSSLVMYSKKALEEAWDEGLSRRHSSGSSESSLDFLEADNYKHTTDGKHGFSKSYGNLKNYANTEKLLKFSNSYSDFLYDQPDRWDKKRDHRLCQEDMSRGHNSTHGEVRSGRVMLEKDQRNDSGRRKMIVSPDGRVGFECTPQRRPESPHPVNLSPLDASKLWAESKLRTESHFALERQDRSQCSQVEMRFVSVHVNGFSPMEMLLNYDNSSLHSRSSSGVQLQSSLTQRNSSTTDDIDCSVFDTTQPERSEHEYIGRGMPYKSSVPDLLHLPCEQSATYRDEFTSVKASTQESRGSSFSLTDFLEKRYSKSLRKRSSGDYEDIWDAAPSQADLNTETRTSIDKMIHVTSPLQPDQVKPYSEDHLSHISTDNQSFIQNLHSKAQEGENHTSPHLHQVTIHSSPLMTPGKNSNCGRIEASPLTRNSSHLNTAEVNSPYKSSPLRRSLTAGCLDVSRDSEQSSRLSFTADMLLNPLKRIPDTPWRLDYLNLEPQQAVVHNTNREYAHSMRQYLSSVPLKHTAMKRVLTPLKLKNMEDSPVRFGRNVDLFHSSDKKAEHCKKSDLFRSDNAPSFQKNHTSTSKIKVENLDLPRLCNSPYRFRRHEYEEITETEIPAQNNNPSGIQQLDCGDVNNSLSVKSADKRHYETQNKLNHDNSVAISISGLKEATLKSVSNQRNKCFDEKRTKPDALNQGNKSFDDEIIYACAVRQKSQSVMNKHQRPESGRVLRQHNRRRRRSAERENANHLSVVSDVRRDSQNTSQSHQENSENNRRYSSYEVRSRNTFEKKREFLIPEIKHLENDSRYQNTRQPFQPLENSPTFSYLNVTR